MLGFTGTKANSCNPISTAIAMAPTSVSAVEMEHLQVFAFRQSGGSSTGGADGAARDGIELLQDYSGML